VPGPGGSGAWAGAAAGPGRQSSGKVLYELLNISYRQSLRLPAELTLLAKSMFNLDAVARAIDPSFSPIPTIRRYGNEMARERAKRDLSAGRLFQLATQSSDLVVCENSSVVFSQQIC
jgi:ubiquinone biosynthesis protein